MSLDSLLTSLEKLCALGRDLVATQQRELDALEERREAAFENFQESEQLVTTLAQLADALRAAPPQVQNEGTDSAATLERMAALEEELALTVRERNEVFDELQRRSHAITDLERQLRALTPAPAATGVVPHMPPPIPAAPPARADVAEGAPAAAAVAAPAPTPAPAPIMPIDFGPLEDFDDDDLDEIQIPLEARVKALPGLFEAREYTPEEVRIASIISYQPYAIREVAQLMGVSPEHARDQVQALIDKGWVDIIV